MKANTDGVFHPSWECGRDPVVVHPRSVKDNPRLCERFEQRLVQKPISQAASEAFDEAILHGFQSDAVSLTTDKRA